MAVADTAGIGSHGRPAAAAGKQRAQTARTAGATRCIMRNVSSRNRMDQVTAALQGRRRRGQQGGTAALASAAPGLQIYMRDVEIPV